MSIQAPKTQGGFTLVELAVVLVIIGVILGAVLKGQELVNNSKGKRLQSELKNLETMMWTYYDRKGRWPGDCDQDGIIEYNIPNSSNPSNNLNTASDPAATACSTAESPNENKDAPLSDLRLAQIATKETSNRDLAKTIAGSRSHFRIGRAIDASDGSIQSNVIVAYGVPLWMAKMIDAGVDGQENGQSGAIRRWDSSDNGSAWPADTNNDTLVSLVYMFDRTLPAPAS